MNFQKPKIGIVGLGYVGQTIRDSYQACLHEVICVDVDPAKSTGNYQDIHECDAVFICVPSPRKDNGECDTSILNSVLYLLKDYKNVIISKTTAPPPFYEKMQLVYPNLVHVPEFLTANNAYEDFTKQTSAVIGGSILAYQREAERILKAVQPLSNVAYCPIGEAALVKYIVNSFLATKVVFMNEMAEFARKNGYEWNRIRGMVALDPRISISHTQVPGSDGSFGFGGMCFPKDTEAAIRFAKRMDVELNVLKSAVKKNLLLRLQKPK